MLVLITWNEGVDDGQRRCKVAKGINDDQNHNGQHSTIEPQLNHLLSMNDHGNEDSECGTGECTNDKTENRGEDEMRGNNVAANEDKQT